MLPAVAIKHLSMKSAATYGERKKRKEKKRKIKKKIPPCVLNERKHYPGGAKFHIRKNVYIELVG